MSCRLRKRTAWLLGIGAGIAGCVCVLMLMLGGAGYRSEDKAAELRRLCPGVDSLPIVAPSARLSESVTRVPLDDATVAVPGDCGVQESPTSRPTDEACVELQIVEEGTRWRAFLTYAAEFSLKDDKGWLKSESPVSEGLKRVVGDIDAFLGQFSTDLDLMWAVHRSVAGSVEREVGPRGAKARALLYLKCAPWVLLPVEYLRGARCHAFVHYSAWEDPKVVCAMLFDAEGRFRGIGRLWLPSGAEREKCVKLGRMVFGSFTWPRGEG